MVNGFDADQFLVELARRRSSRPPSFPNHSRRCRRPWILRPFLWSKKSPDFIDDTRRMVRAAIEEHEQGERRPRRPPPRRQRAATSRDRSNPKAWAAVMAGQYDQVVADYEVGLRRQACRARAGGGAGPVPAGLSSSAEAARKDSDDLVEDLATATNRYAAALKIKPDKHGRAQLGA
ncbi:MAG: hypothetical protein U1E21_01335 [Reyranellaceae bacterium]